MELYELLFLSLLEEGVFDFMGVWILEDRLKYQLGAKNEENKF